MMDADRQKIRAERFLALHQSPAIWVLPNAWDVISARIFESEGFKAIGTTSAGISSVLGYPDGQRMSLEENLSISKRIIDAVQLPVSVDLEAGYASTTDGVVRAARAAWDTGAVGINLEDGTSACDGASPLCDKNVMVERLQAIHEMKSSRDIPLVINARTDVFLFSEESSSAQLTQAVDRGNAYARAGADCVFVPDTGNLNKKTIALLVKEINAPINIIAGANTPPLAELEEIGVTRVSVGPRPMRAALSVVREIAREMIETGTFIRMNAGTLSYAEVNQLLGDCGS